MFNTSLRALRTTFAKCLLILLVLSLLTLDKIESSARRNQLYVHYNLIYRGTIQVDGARTDWDALARDFSEEDYCALASLAALAGEAWQTETFQELASYPCPSMTVVGRERRRLSFSKMSQDNSIRRRGDALEFRRNASVWGALYLGSRRTYEFVVVGQCSGPTPCLLDLSVDGNSHILEFSDIVDSKRLTFALDAGVHQVECSFTNDYSGVEGDRNLRLIEVSIE